MVNIPFDRLEASDDDEVEAEEGFVRTTLDGELVSFRMTRRVRTGVGGDAAVVSVRFDMGFSVSFGRGADTVQELSLLNAKGCDA